MITLANFANPTVWVIVAIVVLVLFGGQKIPEMMKGLGTGVREFKKSVNEDDDELRREAEREKEIRARVEAEMRREDELRRDRERQVR